jgi:hypothetical protein
MGLLIHLERVPPGERYGERIEPWCADHANGYDRVFEAYCQSENIVAREDPRYEGWGDYPILYWRPTDLEACLFWLEASVGNPFNRASYAEALDLMADDPDVYFYSSW